MRVITNATAPFEAALTRSTCLVSPKIHHIQYKTNEKMKAVNEGPAIKIKQMTRDSLLIAPTTSMVISKCE